MFTSLSHHCVVNKYLFTFIIGTSIICCGKDQGNKEEERPKILTGFNAAFDQKKVDQIPFAIKEKLYWKVNDTNLLKIDVSANPKTKDYESNKDNENTKFTEEKIEFTWSAQQTTGKNTVSSSWDGQTWVKNSAQSFWVETEKVPLDIRSTDSVYTITCKARQGERNFEEQTIRCFIPDFQIKSLTFCLSSVPKEKSTALKLSSKDSWKGHHMGPEWLFKGKGNMPVVSPVLYAANPISTKHPVIKVDFEFKPAALKESLWIKYTPERGMPIVASEEWVRSEQKNMNAFPIHPEPGKSIGHFSDLWNWQIADDKKRTIDSKDTKDLDFYIIPNDPADVWKAQIIPRPLLEKIFSEETPWIKNEDQLTADVSVDTLHSKLQTRWPQGDWTLYSKDTKKDFSTILKNKVRVVSRTNCVSLFTRKTPTFDINEFLQSRKNTKKYVSYIDSAFATHTLLSVIGFSCGGEGTPMVCLTLKSTPRLSDGVGVLNSAGYNHFKKSSASDYTKFDSEYFSYTTNGGKK